MRSPPCNLQAGRASPSCTRESSAVRPVAQSMPLSRYQTKWSSRALVRQALLCPHSHIRKRQSAAPRLTNLRRLLGAGTVVLNVPLPLSLSSHTRRHLAQLHACSVQVWYIHRKQKYPKHGRRSRGNRLPRLVDHSYSLWSGPFHCTVSQVREGVALQLALALLLQNFQLQNPYLLRETLPSARPKSIKPKHHNFRLQNFNLLEKRCPQHIQSDVLSR